MLSINQKIVRRIGQIAIQAGRTDTIDVIADSLAIHPCPIRKEVHKANYSIRLIMYIKERIRKRKVAVTPFLCQGQGKRRIGATTIAGLFGIQVEIFCVDIQATLYPCVASGYGNKDKEPCRYRQEIITKGDSFCIP